MRLTDDIIGEIIDNLKATDLWEDTLFILTTDNGGDIEKAGCNYPLRGTKGTLFEGNQRTIAMIGGGRIPKEIRGTTRDALFSSLDWTPTLLSFAGILPQIAKEDRTWDGIDQSNMIFHGEDKFKQRDHILFSIGMRNLDSATIVFKNPLDDDKLYKYIAQDVSIEKAGYMRTDGWCTPDETTGDWAILTSDSEGLADETQELDGKFLFSLEDDVSEMNNLLISAPEDSDDIVDYAISLITPYMDHPLFSEHIAGLWLYDGEEDDSANGDESFIHPWLTRSEYQQAVNHFIDNEGTHHDNPIPDDLKTLYNKRWISPKILAKVNKVKVTEDDESAIADTDSIELINKNSNS